MAGEQMVRANGVDLCVETFGDRAEPAILLVMGAAASMLHWDAEFCRRLAAGGRYVVRYDHRDTGRSVTYQPGKPLYGLRDLVADAVGILDALGLDRAHVAGMSMGGGIGQLLALDHGDRVASLTLLSATPGGPGYPADDLPGMAEGMFSDDPGEPDWSDRAAVVDYLVGAERACAGSHGFDEQRWRGVAERMVDRAADIAAFGNHFLLEGGEPWRHRLGAIEAPTLVLHGVDDPMFPYPHGQALAAEIPGARLVAMPGTGHEPPPPCVWDAVVSAITAHTAG